MSDKDRALQIADEFGSAHEKYKTGHDIVSGFLSRFDLGSSVELVGNAVAHIEPEAVMTATCVVLSAASNVASMKVPDMTMHKVLAALEKIEGKLDQILKTPLNMAIDYYRTVINAVLTGNFKHAFEQLGNLISNAREAFHFANTKDIGVESYR